MSRISKKQSLVMDQALIAGIHKHLSSFDFIVDSKAETAAQVLAVLRRRVKLAEAVEEAHAALATAILASDEEATATTAFVRSIRQGILAMFANSPTILADFDMSVRKSPTPLTAAEQMLAVEKRAATRAARHTMGPVQKAAIHGTLSGPVVVALDGEATVESSSTPDPVVTPQVTATPRS
jgi:hypothetical protein